MDLPQAEADIFETILTQQTIRKFKSRKIESRVINVVLEAANYAPLTNGFDPRTYIVIQGRSLLLSLKAKSYLIKELHLDDSMSGDRNGSDDSSYLFNANTLIFIGGKTTDPCHVADCWLAAGNLILSASAMGLGANIIHESSISMNTLTIKNKLNIPIDFTLIASIAIGYAEILMPSVIRQRPPIIAWVND